MGATGPGTNGERSSVLMHGQIDEPASARPDRAFGFARDMHEILGVDTEHRVVNGDHARAAQHDHQDISLVVAMRIDDARRRQAHQVRVQVAVGSQAPERPSRVVGSTFCNRTQPDDFMVTFEEVLVTGRFAPFVETHVPSVETATGTTVAAMSLQWNVGAVRITSVAELDDGVIPGEVVLPEASAAAIQAIDWLRPQFADDDGNVRLRIQALIVESEGRRIVIDTCLGNDKPRNQPFFHMLQTPFLRDLTAAGFGPDTIDTVICTHLHVDHIGWNTVFVDGAWVPTFPKARYLLSRIDVEHWAVTESPEGDLFGDSVKPVIDAGLADLVDAPFAVTSEVSLIPTPGHSPGHVSVRIASGGEEAIITGDVMHHPSQCARPSWASSFDVDATHAEKTRREFLDTYADADVLIIGTHFATPGAGHIRRDGDAYRFAT
jgi:glyoxylase-like metal-dependent hydrolase (beta-lactamase superfamily II)